MQASHRDLNKFMATIIRDMGSTSSLPREGETQQLGFEHHSIQEQWHIPPT